VDSEFDEGSAGSGEGVMRIVIDAVVVVVVEAVGNGWAAAEGLVRSPFDVVGIDSEDGAKFGAIAPEIGVSATVVG
jgi:hypothetical protein